MLISATAALAARRDDPILYRGPFSVILPRIAEDGFSGVELHLLDSRQIDRAALWRLLEENNLKLTSLGTGSAYRTLRYNLVDTDASVRRATIAHLEEHAKTLAHDRGVLIIGLIAGRQSDSKSSIAIQKGRLADSLLALDKIAGVYGVKIGLELMNRYESDFLHTVKEGIAFLSEVGNPVNVGLHIDCVSLNISERDIGEAIRKGRGRICHVHLSDNDRWYPGHGHYNFHETLQALSDIDYSGALALEEKARPNSATAARASIRHIRTVLESLDRPSVVL